MNRQGTELAIEAIGVSLGQSLRRLMESERAALHFSQAFFEVQQLPYAIHLEPLPDGLAKPLGLFHQVQEDAVHDLLRDRRRYALLAAIGILDSFLSDTLRLYLLHNPGAISTAVSSKAVAKFARLGLPLEEQVEQIVRRYLMSWRGRLDFLMKEFEVLIAQNDLDELGRLVELRNEVAHHVGLYGFTKDSATGAVYADARKIPEVSSRESLCARMLVAEVTDCILVAMSQDLFGFVPSTRPVTSDVARVHAELRAQWAESDQSGTFIEDVLDPDWKVHKASDGDLIWVGERSGNFMVVPTGIPKVPALISSRRNNRHGTRAVIAVDENDRIDLGGSDSARILSELLQGQVLVLEFNEEPTEGSKLVRYSLGGFSAAWDAACEARAAAGSSK